jgi:RNA polymerase sigma-70 factor (ECF subfamily)
MQEEELLRRSREGDLDCFNALVERYQDSIYGLALRLLGDSARAEDAAQDAFIAAFRSLRSLRGSFRPWLFRIAVNCCYDQLRLARRRRETSLDALRAEETPPAPLRDPGESPEDHAQRAELEMQINLGLSRLQPDRRVALALRDIQGFTYEDIARITRASLGTVKSRISRGRAELRDYLLAQGELLPSRYRHLSDEGSKAASR